jgi:hypothetical protein
VCIAQHQGQSAEVQGAPPIKPPSQTAAAPPGQGAEVQRVPPAALHQPAAPLLSVEVQRVAPTTPQPPSSSSSTPGRAQRFQSCRRHQPPRAAAAPRQQGTQVQRCRRMPSTFALPGPTDASAWTTVGELRKVDRTPTSHHARSQASSPPFQRARQPARPAADSAAAITPAPSPGPLWFLLPHATFGRQLQRLPGPIAFSSTASPGVSVKSTPTTGSSTKAQYGRSPVTPHMACAAIARPPHRMTISLLAMPSIHAMQQPI